MSNREHKRFSGYTGLIVKDPPSSRDFYTSHLGFETQIDTNAYIHLVHPRTGFELAILREGELNEIKQLESSTTGEGLWLGLEVDDVDDESARLWDAGITILQAPKDQPWGERTIVIKDPNGVLIYLAHKIKVEKTEVQETENSSN